VSTNLLTGTKLGRDLPDKIYEFMKLWCRIPILAGIPKPYMAIPFPLCNIPLFRYV
jgi:hypothetical protein